MHITFILHFMFYKFQNNELIKTFTNRRNRNRKKIQKKLKAICYHQIVNMRGNNIIFNHIFITLLLLLLSKGLMASIFGFRKHTHIS